MLKLLSTLLKLSLLLLTALCLSCDNEPKNGPMDLDFIDEAQKTVIMELIINDMESLVLNAMINLEIQDPGGTVETHVDVSIFSVRGNCAREIDTNENRMALNLSSCIDHYEILRDGEIVIAYDDAFDEPGNLIQVQLNDYRYENISITGDFSVLNTSEDTSELRSYEMTFPETALNFVGNSGNFVFSGSRTIEVFEQPGSFRDPNVLSLVDASWNIQPVIGVNFEISTIGVLTHRIDCWSDGFYFPRSGKQQIKGANLDFLIDYNKSVCGWELAITNGSEESQSFTLQQLFEN